MDEEEYLAKNFVKVTYKHKKRKYDFGHIIFVFSGFLDAKPGNYDFINALTDCPCDVIWIGDIFEAKYAYYLCHDMNFKIRDAVAEFMKIKLSELGLSIDNATVTGFSKGGSAALYFGLFLDIKNIVITVPQITIGSYLNSHWKDVANHIMGEGYNNSHITYMDRLLVNLLKKDKNFQKNIYLLTSESDIQYKDQIEPYLSDFSRYSNFNLLKTYSVFVREHNQVTGHHTALLLSIYYSLASEAIPRYSDGEVNFFGSHPIPVVSSNVDELEAYVDLRFVDYKEDRLFISGVGLIKGIHVQEYQDIEYTLIFKNNTLEVEKKLAKVHRPHLTREMFNGDFVIYDKAVFTTYQHKGMLIDDIDTGLYKLLLKIKVQDKQVVTPIVSKNNIDLNTEKIGLNCTVSSCWVEVYQ